MEITYAFDFVNSNFYPSEFYKHFLDYLKSEYKIKIKYSTVSDLAKKYKINFDYNNNLPSILNKNYNLVIINEKNEKFFIHSWSDHSPSMLENGSGIEKLDVSVFSCVSNLNNKIIEKYSDKYLILPSTYILENWNDHELIEKNKNNTKQSNKIFFNGLWHYLRDSTLKNLQNSDLFLLKDKSTTDFKEKNEYFEEVSRFRYGLSLKGAADICYRDLEYFGLGIINFRDEMNVLTHNPLIEDVHYKKIIKDSMKIDLISHIPQIENNILEFINNEKLVNEMIYESLNWFNENCTINSQTKIFDFLFRRFLDI